LRADVPVVKDNQVKNRIRPNIVVLSADWIRQIPSSGRVNSPEILTSLYPGQKITVAILTEGPDRDALLNGMKMNLRFSSPSKGTQEFNDLKPVATRQIKAEGADFAMMALNAGGISLQDRTAMEKATSLVSFAVFETDWSVPMGDPVEEVQISVALSGSSSLSTIEPMTIKVRPAGDWMKEPLPSREEVGRYMNRYHEDMAPGHLLLLLRAIAESGDIQMPSIFGFFTVAYKENQTARDAAVTLFPTLDKKTQDTLLVILRLGGQNLSTLLPALTKERVASFDGLAALKDARDLPHYKDPVTPEAVSSIGVIMDQCWAGWMATGDKSYLRALVGLLEGAPDSKVFESWQNTRGGVKGLNAQVARGLAYQIAGWSIGSFRRTDPLVSDWLLFWENDPAFPPMLRKEIASLSNNPAFRRK
jgi:hypothetical protein